MNENDNQTPPGMSKPSVAPDPGVSNRSSITTRDVAAIARRLYAEGPVFQRTLKQLRPHICPFEDLIVQVPRDSSVLDVGCGAGMFLALLASFGRLGEGHGIDVNQAAIDLANRMTNKLDAATPLRFERVDPEDPWPEGAFDVVCMIDVMHHIAPGQQAAVFEQAGSRLRPGGLFLYKDMAERPLWQAWANRLHDLVLAREWIHYLPLADALSHAADAGFEVIVQGGASRLWYAHEWVIFRLADKSAASDLQF